MSIQYLTIRLISDAISKGGEMITLLDQILNGLAMGSIYAIITLGLALVYGVMCIGSSG